MTNEMTLEQMQRSWKFKIEQTARGSRVTAHGDDIDQVVADYILLKHKLEAAGQKVAPED